MLDRHAALRPDAGSLLTACAALAASFLPLGWQRLGVHCAACLHGNSTEHVCRTSVPSAIASFASYCSHRTSQAAKNHVRHKLEGTVPALSDTCGRVVSYIEPPPRTRHEISPRNMCRQRTQAMRPPQPGDARLSGEVLLVIELVALEALLDAQQQAGLPAIQPRQAVVFRQRVRELLPLPLLQGAGQVLGTWAGPMSAQGAAQVLGTSAGPESAQGAGQVLGCQRVQSQLRAAVGLLARQQVQSQHRALVRFWVRGHVCSQPADPMVTCAAESRLIQGRARVRRLADERMRPAGILSAMCASGGQGIQRADGLSRRAVVRLSALQIRFWTANLPSFKVF